VIRRGSRCRPRRAPQAEPPRTEARLVPRRFASPSCPSSTAPILSKNSNSSRTCPHHLPTVGGDRERHAVLGEGAEGIADGVLVWERLRQQVRGRADLEHDLGLAELGHQLLVLRGEDPVPDPVGTQGRDDLADLGDPVLAALLAGVDVIGLDPMVRSTASRSLALRKRGTQPRRIGATIGPLRRTKFF
jgi:hypothetical protein